MQLVLMVFIMPLVPLPALVASVPVLGRFACIWGWRSTVAHVVMPHVFCLGDDLQVFGLIVASVMVFVVNVPSVRDLPAIEIRPNNSMQADAVALEIIAAQVVAATLIFLSCL